MASPVHFSLTHQKKRILPSLLFSWTFSIPGRADATRRKSWRKGEMQHEPLPRFSHPAPAVSRLRRLLVLTWAFTVLSGPLTMSWRAGAALTSLPHPQRLSFQLLSTYNLPICQFIETFLFLFISLYLLSRASRKDSWGLGSIENIQIRPQMISLKGVGIKSHALEQFVSMSNS